MLFGYIICQVTTGGKPTAAYAPGNKNGERPAGGYWILDIGLILDLILDSILDWILDSIFGIRCRTTRIEDADVIPTDKKQMRSNETR